MLAGVRRLFQGHGCLSFHHKAVEILGQQDGNRIGQSSDDADLDIVDLIENAKGTVLKDRISIQY
ncbi:MAG: hypothetical protein DMF06_02355 [Verrucomicrobia bacterium]|nr:MAG: hypothetical protein DMF06_02355 [Verrucomicrobiota bacterium]